MNAEKAIFIKLQGNMTLTAFYFYQALYALFSLLNHFSSCQKENKNKWREEKKHPNPSHHHFTWLQPSQTFYQYSPLSVTCSYCLWANLKHLSCTLSHSYWFLSTVSLLSGKMSYETQIPLLKGSIQHVLQYWESDNSITVDTIFHVFWQHWWPRDHDLLQ